LTAGVEVAKARGDWVDPSLSRVAVRDWAATWLSTQRQLKPSTLDRYTGIVDKHITPTLGLVALAELTPALIDEWMTGLHRYGLSAASVRQCHRVLSRMLAYAVRDGRLSRNPAEGADLPRVTPRTKVYLSHAELARLAGECGTNETAVLLLGYSGLRWGEFAALRVRDVDLIRRRVHVQRAMVELRCQVIIGTPKDHEQREVPLPRFLVDPLAQALAGRAADALAFTSPEGAIMRNNNFRRRCFDAAAIRADVPGITPHGLRQTAASLAIQAGAPVTVVSKMLGHADPSITLRVYAHLWPSDLDALADRLHEAKISSDADQVRTGSPVVDLRPPSQEAGSAS
jgi:integrase